MPSAATDLRRALETFRRSQGLAYLQRLSGQVPERVAARAWLTSEQGAARRAEALSNGELSPAEDGALCAHIARAASEARYERARQASTEFLRRPVSVEGEPRPVRDLLLEWSGTRFGPAREALARAVDKELQSLSQVLLSARAESDAAVSEVLARLLAPRHPDAGPEGGSGSSAERWLNLTQELAQEAFSFARAQFGVDGKSGLDNLWAVLGTELRGLFPREGRLRRLAADWEPLGLRVLLRSRARAALEHPGPYPHPHLVVLSAATDMRVSASSFELGLSSELASAEAVGRALGLAHASASLPLTLRHASVGSVARAVGSLAVLRITEPLFLRRTRGLTQRESQTVARLAVAYALAESRLSAAAVLARGLRFEDAPEQASSLASRAMAGSVPPGWGACLALRLSPGGPFRARSWAPAFLATLRERFDEDWFLNPRAAEPLAGALARGGSMSVESWAEELGASFERGPVRLAELF